MLLTLTSVWFSGSWFSFITCHRFSPRKYSCRLLVNFITNSPASHPQNSLLDNKLSKTPVWLCKPLPDPTADLWWLRLRPISLVCSALTLPSISSRGSATFYCIKRWAFIIWWEFYMKIIWNVNYRTFEDQILIFKWQPHLVKSLFNSRYLHSPKSNIPQREPTYLGKSTLLDCRGSFSFF